MLYGCSCTTLGVSVHSYLFYMLLYVTADGCARLHVLTSSTAPGVERWVRRGWVRARVNARLSSFLLLTFCVTISSAGKTGCGIAVFLGNEVPDGTCVM